MMRWRLVAKKPDDPVIVVPMRKVFQSAIGFVEGCESFEPKQLLLQCSSKSFDAFVSFWTPDEWWTRSNADKSQLNLKRMRNELTSVIVQQRRETCGVAVVHFVRTRIACRIVSIAS